MLTSAEARISDPVLSEYARGYVQPNRVGSTLFPVAPVVFNGGKVIEFGKEAFRLYNARRSPGSTTKEITFGYHGRPYQLVEDALDGLVPQELADDAQQVPGIDLGMRTTRVIMTALTLAVEIEQAALATNPANYDAGHQMSVAGTDKWTDPASKPIAQLRHGIEVVRQSIGIRPNVAVFSAGAFAAFEENASVVDRFKLSSPIMTTTIVASLLRLDRVVIAESVYADDNDNFIDVWGNNVILAYAQLATAGVEQPSFGYTYVRSGYPLVQTPFWDTKRRSWLYGVTYRRLPVLTGLSAGFLIQNPA